MDDVEFEFQQSMNSLHEDNLAERNVDVYDMRARETVPLLLARFPEYAVNDDLFLVHAIERWKETVEETFA